MTKITKIEPTKTSEKKKLRVAAYCRVSTSQDEQLESLAVQRAHYDQVIKKNENWIFAGIYYDEGLTATKKDNRPELLRLLEDCKAGKIDLVLTKSISRFSRNTTDCLEMVRTLCAHGVGIFFERENINSLTMEDEFILTVLGSLAENESQSISENEKWSIRKRFMKGTFRQAVAPYGYRLEDGCLVPDEETAPVVRFIFELACAGKGAHKIAKALNEKGIKPVKADAWRPTTIQGMLQNERYVGDALYQKTYCDSEFVRHTNYGECDQFLHQDHHEALVTREQFQIVQDMIAQHRMDWGIDPEKHNYKKRYLFSGKLVCGECGSKLKRVILKDRVSGNYIAWVCSAHVLDVESCSMKNVPEESIKAAFTTVTNKLIFSRRELLEPFVKAVQNSCGGDVARQIDEINQKLDALAEKSRTLNALAADNLLEPAALKKALADLAGSRAELNSRKDALNARIQTNNKGVSEGAKLLKRIQGMRISDEFDEELFQEFVNQVHIYTRQEFGFEFTCGLIFREAVTLK